MFTDVQPHENVQNMKPAQICTGFIFCTFYVTVNAKSRVFYEARFCKHGVGHS